MRIAAKFTVILVAAMTVVLVVQASLHYRRVAALHEQETRDDLAILARALGNASSEIWASSGEDRARAYIQGADARRARTRITLHEGPPPDSVADNDPPTPLRDGESLVANVPLVVAGRTRAFIELRRSLDRTVEFRRTAIWSQVTTTGVLALVAALVSMLLGVAMIGRPVRQLIEQTRRVARGELDATIELRQHDELGNLASELNRMTSQLETARGQLQTQRHARAALQEQLRHADRLSTVGRVASGIAHELGTPLNVVAGRAAMIVSEADDDGLKRHAEIIAEQAKRMTGIIRELLDFSRRRGIKRESTRIHEVIDQARTLLEPIAESHGVSVAVDELGELEAAIDVNKTLQVLTNLMMNAMQAMPEGGQLSLRASARSVDEPKNDHAEPGDFVAIEIQDEGIGIPEEDLELIFRPFFTTKRAGRGTGLGLYVCQGIIREQSGWIEVESEPGRGSTFTVYLPQHVSERDGQ